MFCKNDSLLILLQFQALLWNNNNVFIADLQEWRDSSTDHDQHRTLPFQLGVAFNGQEPGPLLHHQHQPNTKCPWMAGVDSAPSPDPQQGPARRPHNINYLGHSAVSNKTVSSWGGSREREVLIPQFRLIGSNIFSTNIISFPYSAYFPNVTLSKYRCRNVQSSILDFPLKHPALHYVTVLWFCLIKIGEVIESLWWMYPHWMTYKRRSHTQIR